MCFGAVIYNNVWGQAGWGLVLNKGLKKQFRIGNKNRSLGRR